MGLITPPNHRRDGTAKAIAIQTRLPTIFTQSSSACTWPSSTWPCWTQCRWTCWQCSPRHVPAIEPPYAHRNRKPPQWPAEDPRGQASSTPGSPHLWPSAAHRRVCPSWPQRSAHSCYSDSAAPGDYECGCCPVHSALYQHKLGYDKIVLVGPSAISLRCNLVITS